jgi:ferredoxin-thioredoxin reductase catalytic subunit
MTQRPDPAADAEALRQELDREANAAGYRLNPDEEFARGLAEGLLTNEARYGYRACPCRLASGDAERDRDIVCPCDYRDADLLEWGGCYCGLYVSADVAAGTAQPRPVPERRPPVGRRSRPSGARLTAPPGIRVWRCRVCGYLCAREHPPATCPICKATSDRFEAFS